VLRNSDPPVMQVARLVGESRRPINTARSVRCSSLALDREEELNVCK
jgi:hypothetical protein